MGTPSIAKLLIGTFSFTSWLSQGFGHVKTLPPTVAKIYHALGQVVFIGYFLVWVLKDVSYLQRIFLFFVYEVCSWSTVNRHRI